jgi:hypothetical protein
MTLLPYGAGCVVACLLLAACDSRAPSSDSESGIAPSAISKEGVCRRDAEKIIAEADALIAAGNYADAQKKIVDCRILLGSASTTFDPAFNRAAIAEAQDALKSLPKSDWEQRLKRLREIKEADGPLDAVQTKEIVALEAKSEALSKQRVAADKAVSSLKYYPFCNELGRAVRASKRSIRDEAVISHAKSTYGVTQSELPAVRSKQIEVGMSMCGIVAVLGTPSQVREIQSVGRKGWSVWYSDQRALLYLDQNQNVVSFSR